MPSNKQSNSTNLAIYGALVILSVAASLLKNVLLYCISLKASKKLHNMMTTAVIKAPVLFFDTNPAGRIMNRFSKDIGSMDDMLPYSFLWATNTCLYTLNTLLLPAGTNPWLVLVSVFVLTVVLYFMRYYLKSSRELKRLEAVSCSPVYSHIADTISGLEVIHSSKMSHSFLKMFAR